VGIMGIFDLFCKSGRNDGRGAGGEYKFVIENQPRKGTPCKVGRRDYGGEI